jgi:hypothetical protein
MSRILVALIAGTMGLLIGEAPAEANNDPHRVFLAQAPFDIPANVCGFTVHVEFPVNRVYANVSAGADGSTIVKASGSLVKTFTNVTNGHAVTLNSSGPGTATFPPGTTLEIFDIQGLNSAFVTNGAQFGLPNLMYTSGKFMWTRDFFNATIVSIAHPPNVKLDICAAIT